MKIKITKRYMEFNVHASRTEVIFSIEDHDIVRSLRNKILKELGIDTEHAVLGIEVDGVDYCLEIGDSVILSERALRKSRKQSALVTDYLDKVIEL